MTQMQRPITLLVGYYNDPSPQRMAEFVECLKRNITNENISAIHVFDETHDQDAARSVPVLQHTKVVVVPHGSRMRFADYLGYANAYLSGNIVVVANTDIYFDETLALLVDYPLVGQLLALTRWDVQADGSIRFLDHDWSQDAWVFVPPVPEFPSDWFLGLQGSDGRLAYEATKAGLIVLNPSLSIRVHHLHLSKVWRYNPSERLPGGYLKVPITDAAGNRIAPPRTLRSDFVVLVSVATGLALGTYASMRALEWALGQRTRA